MSGTRLTALLAALIGGTSNYFSMQFNGDFGNIMTSLSSIPMVYDSFHILNIVEWFCFLSVIGIVVSMVIIGVGQGT